MSERFTGNGLSYWDVSNVYDFSYMLSETSLLFNINLSSWDVSNAKIFDGMFCNTSSFIGIGLEFNVLLFNIFSRIWYRKLEYK